jgi:hypothetical protein
VDVAEGEKVRTARAAPSDPFARMGRLISGSTSAGFTLVLDAARI